ncbi:MAG: hypothetical protein EXR72_13320 [Myxococcales bacterium]|nr:hypothetical protein [Myxococcales bacterium]
MIGGVLGGTPTEAPPPPKPKNIPAHQLDTEVIYRPDPHLPEAIKAQRKGSGEATFTAKVCVGMDGKVSNISVLTGIPGADDAILATIRQWKYKPQPIPVCFIANWVFTIE